MNIEISGDVEHLKVIESVVREFVPVAYHVDASSTKAHFQARIEIDEAAKGQYFNCELSYYDSARRFLGASETDVHKKRSITGEPRLISEQVDVPDATELVVARFILEEDHWSVPRQNYLYAAAGFFLAIVLHWISHIIFQ